MWSYVTDTILTVHGRTTPFTHRDQNTLVKVNEALPNPLARIIAAKTADVDSVTDRLAPQAVGQGLALTLGGIALGLAAAMASTPLMTGLLYEVTPTDLAAFAAAVATVVGTAIAAGCGPAVKASLIDPLVALRCE